MTLFEFYSGGHDVHVCQDVDNRVSHKPKVLNPAQFLTETCTIGHSLSIGKSQVEHVFLQMEKCSTDYSMST